MPEIIRRDAPRLVTIDTLDFAPQYAGPPCADCGERIPPGAYAIAETVQLRNRGIASYYAHPACFERHGSVV